MRMALPLAVTFAKSCLEIGLIGALVISAIGCQCHSGQASTQVTDSSETVDDYENAKQALDRKDFDLATNHVRQAMLLSPQNRDLLELKGDILRASGNPLEAIDWYLDAKSGSGAKEPPTSALLEKLGRTMMEQGLVFRALDVLKESVEIYPNDQQKRADLAGLLASLGHEREAAEHLRWLVQRGHSGIGELIILSDLHRPQTDETMCQSVLKRYPNEIAIQFSLARLDAYAGRWQEVADRLAPIMEAKEIHPAAFALVGRAFVELKDTNRVDSWLQSLPQGIDEEAQYWLAIGIHREHSNDMKGAAKAYWQACCLDEFDAESIGLLSASLAKLGDRSEARARLAQRISAIAELRRSVDSLIAGGRPSQAKTIEIAKQLERLGRSWEAAAWLRVGATMPPEDLDALQSTYLSIHSRLNGRTPWQRPEGLFIHEMEFSWFDRPIVKSVQEGHKSSKIVKSSSSFRLEDQSQQRNLKHTCEINKPKGEESELWIYQSIAGGAGVIDYDLDGWPDLYLTNMNGNPMAEDSDPNHLYRNVAGSFSTVTSMARVGDCGFAQGIAIGDLNADGFPDLLVANIGQNRLYMNNGDGTFEEQTMKLGLQGQRWTTSVAIADIDLDGLADLFEVGYCAGKEPFEKQCERDGLIRSCSPVTFSAEKDRVFQCNPDGTFTNVTDRWLGEHNAGCGLGIVVGNLDGAAGMDLYVANDMSANHLWSAVGSDETEFHLEERASISGVAVDSRSLAQASMGIATADVDHDGDIDFFLTNHAGESNMFYEQVSQGVWVDQSSRVGLPAISTPLLGFGTVWFDADNDGTLELFVANGHVDDFRHLGDAFRMPSQLVRQTEKGPWLLIENSSLGDYFRTDRLARNVVRLDANRDGQLDILVTHLFDPVALLINRTEPALNSVTFFLKGTSAHPDAIGSTVRIRKGGRWESAPLIGGDGFQCSGQRSVHFGLGDEQGVESIEVEWIGGEVESFGLIAEGGEYLLVQHEGAAFPCSRQPK